jgi:hypothetical protein
MSPDPSVPHAPGAVWSHIRDPDGVPRGPHFLVRLVLPFVYVCANHPGSDTISAVIGYTKGKPTLFYRGRL